MWIVREVKAPDVVAVEALQFDQGGVAHRAYMRRDSLSAVDDSTQIVSTFELGPLVANVDSATREPCCRRCTAHDRGQDATRRGAAAVAGATQGDRATTCPPDYFRPSFFFTSSIQFRTTLISESSATGASATRCVSSNIAS